MALSRIPRLLFVLFLLLPSVFSTAVFYPVHLARRTGHNRHPKFDGIRHSPNTRTAVACVHHAATAGVGAAAVPPWLMRRGSSQYPVRNVLSDFIAGVVATGALIVVLHVPVRLAATGVKAYIQHVASTGEGGGSAEESVKGAMISFIKGYKKELSPLIPPACRFLPTCSVYAGARPRNIYGCFAKTV